MGNQKGFAALSGICVILILSLLAMSAYIVVRREMKGTRHFIASAALQMEAQNGIRGALDYLRAHPETVNTLSAAKSKSIWSGRNTENGISCAVYVRKQGEIIYLMAESEKEKTKTRLYARLAKKDESGYRIERWGAVQ